MCRGKFVASHIRHLIYHMHIPMHRSPFIVYQLCFAVFLVLQRKWIVFLFLFGRSVLISFYNFHFASRKLRFTTHIYTEMFNVSYISVIKSKIRNSRRNSCATVFFSESTRIRTNTLKKLPYTIILRVCVCVCVNYFGKLFCFCFSTTPQSVQDVFFLVFFS